MLTITDRLTKKMAMIPGKITWTAEQWEQALISRLFNFDWGLAKIIIADR
jgi:hypothetical protein